METRFFPIKSENLASYFRSAIIKPRRYYLNQENTDIQEKYRDFLFISTKHFIKDDNADCSLELILTDEEIKELKTNPLNSECFLFSKPLPITRIKSIKFKSAEQRENTLNSARKNSGFIPEKLISQDIYFEMVENPFSGNIFPSTDYTQKIDSFNRLLGAFALMRLVTQEDMTYSKHYFSRLAKYNKRIEETIQNTPLANIEELVFKDTVCKYYKNKITDDIVKKVADSEDQKLKPKGKKRTYDLEFLEGGTYIIAFIRDHQANENDEGRDKIDGYIINHFEGLKYAEDLAFYYGYNKGYSAFKKSYESNETNEVNYKYKLETKLDYYTIENVYQRCINDKTNDADFRYIETLFDTKIVSEIALKDNQINVLGEIVTYKNDKKKEDFLDASQEFSKHYSELDMEINRIKEITAQIVEEEKQILKEQFEKEKIRYESRIKELETKLKDYTKESIIQSDKAEKEKIADVKPNSANFDNTSMLIKDIESYIKDKTPTKGELKKILSRYTDPQLGI